MPKVLLVGGHGKVALRLTPLILSRGWSLTSLIRSPPDPSQADDIHAAARPHSTSNLTIINASLEHMRSTHDAAQILASHTPDYVIWSAGAGGKGGRQRTAQIDRDAAIFFIDAALDARVQKFITISYPGSRRNKPPWWSEEDWASSEEVNRGALAHYYEAKVAADEHVTAAVEVRRRAGEEVGQVVCLRPGRLTDEEGSGRVRLGKIRPQGQVSRANVAEVVVRLLETEGARGWIDLLDGDEDVEAAVERVGREQVDCVDGEDVEAMVNRLRAKTQ